MSDRLGLLGGTFDPLHHGHLIVAQEALNELSLMMITFVPTRVPPHKPPAKARPEQRLAMLEKGLEPFEHFKVSTVELDREPPSYTVDTLKTFRQRHSEETELLFIVGTDSLETLTEWKDWKTVTELSTVIGLARPGYNPDQIPEAVRGRVSFIDSPVVEISSSRIRQRIRNNRPFEAFLPLRLSEYIRSNNLYGAVERP